MIFTLQDWKRSSAEPRWGWDSGGLRATESSPVCAGDSGTQWLAHQCFHIIGISWNLWHNFRVMEAGDREVLWELEIWIPNPLSGIWTLSKNDCELKSIIFLADFAFVKHRAIFSLGLAHSRGPEGLLRKEHFYLQCCRRWWFFSGFVSAFYIVSLSLAQLSLLHTRGYLGLSLSFFLSTFALLNVLWPGNQITNLLRIIYKGRGNQIWEPAHFPHVQNEGAAIDHCSKSSPALAFYDFSE